MIITTSDSKVQRDVDVVKTISKEIPVFVLGANTMEGRDKMTYWDSKEEMEKYRVACIKGVKPVEISRG